MGGKMFNDHPMPLFSIEDKLRSLAWDLDNVANNANIVLRGYNPILQTQSWALVLIE